MVKIDTKGHLVAVRKNKSPQIMALRTDVILLVPTMGQGSLCGIEGFSYPSSTQLLVYGKIEILYREGYKVHYKSMYRSACVGSDSCQ